MGNNKNWLVSRRGLSQHCSLYFLLGWLLISVSGCSKPDADQLLGDYQQRLERVLTLAAADVELSPAPPLPAIRDIRHSIAESQLDLLDLVALRHCNLQQLLAERNNSLGKVMTSSNLLGYEIKLHQAIQPCLHHPALSAALRQELQHIYQQKQQQLPLLLENFLTTDPTLRKQLGGQQRLLGQGASQAITEPLTALKNLNRLKQAIVAGEKAAFSEFDSSYINRQLAVLYQGNFVADWQFSIRRSNAWLSTLNLQLSAVQIDTLCRQPAKLDILNTILTQIFTQRVQAYLAELDGISYQLVPELQQLYSGTALQGTVEQRLAEPAAQLRELLKQHVRWYQQLQQQCRQKPSTTTA